MSEPYAGYEAHKRIHEVLPLLARSIREAFTIACVERVLPLAKWYFGAEQHHKLFDHCVELCWAHALRLQSDPLHVQAGLERCEELIDKLYEKDEGGSAFFFVVDGLSHALQSLAVLESAIAERAIVSAGDAARAGDVEHGDEHVKEESGWQLLALDVAQRAKVPTRAMFDELRREPTWLGLFRQRKGIVS